MTPLEEPIQKLIKNENKNKEEYNNLLKKIQDGEVLDEEKEKELKDIDQELIDMYNDFDR